MPTPFESATLNLQLFDLRRESVLREARDWFLREFNPQTFAELVALVSGERNASFRMVLGYWDMAASLVTTGAIDGDAFRAAHGEIFATFGKIQPLLAELRSASGEQEFCRHIEAVVLAAPGAEATLIRRREAMRAVARMQAERDADEQAIRSLVDAWLRATAAGDLPRVLELMADDVVFLGAGRPSMKGKEAFAAASKAQNGNRIDGRVEVQEIKVFGDWAYCWNHVTITTYPSGGGAPARLIGPALSILRKERDGRWVIFRDANMVAAA
jgi:uncharacterized protein (TIGR02246 family)